MKIDVYGKSGCAKCESTKAKLSHCLKKWAVEDSVTLEFVDLDTPDGLARGAFNDVFDVIPVTIVCGDQEETLGRWEGTVPPSEEAARALGLNRQ